MLDEMLEPQTDVKALKVSDLTVTKPLLVVNKGFTDIIKGLVLVQEDASFDPGGKPNSVFVENCDVIDDDGLTVESLIVTDVLMMGEEMVQMETTNELGEITKYLMGRISFDLGGKASKFDDCAAYLSNGGKSSKMHSDFTASEFALSTAEFGIDVLILLWRMSFDPGGAEFASVSDYLAASLISNKSELVDEELNHKAILVGFAEGKDDLKAFEDKMNFKLQNLLKRKFTDSLEMLNKLTTRGKMMAGYLSVLSFDPGGGLHASGDAVLLTNASKFTEIGKRSLQVSCAEIGVVVSLGVLIHGADFHLGWNTKVGFSSWLEFMLNTEGEESMISFYPTSMQKIEVLKVDNSMLVGAEKGDFVACGSKTTNGITPSRHMIGIRMMLAFDKWEFVDEFTATASRILGRYTLGICLVLNAYIRVLTFDPGAQLSRAFIKPFLEEFLLDDHVIYLTRRCDSRGWLVICLLNLHLSYCSVMNLAERVNLIAHIFVAHMAMGVVDYELLNYYDIKGSPISGFWEHKCPALGKYSTDHASTSLSSTLVGSSAANKEAWGLLVKAYWMIVNIQGKFPYYTKKFLAMRWRKINLMIILYLNPSWVFTTLLRCSVLGVEIWLKDLEEFVSSKCWTGNLGSYLHVYIDGVGFMHIIRILEYHISAHYAAKTDLLTNFGRKHKVVLKVENDGEGLTSYKGFKQFVFDPRIVFSGVR